MDLKETMDKTFRELQTDPECVDHSCRACQLRNALMDSEALMICYKVHHEIHAGEISIKMGITQATALGMELGERLAKVIAEEGVQ